MKKKPIRKVAKKIDGTKRQTIIAGPSEISQNREEELAEIDRIAKMLVRRDFELSTLRERRELELKELKKRTEELEESKIALTCTLEDIEDSRRALMNMLEDAEEGRKKVEEEKNKTATIIKNLADGLLVFDKGNKLSLVNSQAEIFFQMKTEEVMGKSLSQLAILPFFKPLAELLLKETAGIFRRELHLKENLILEISTIPLTTEKEKLGKLVILHDITREKIVEKMKTEFVSLAAHQLRTPLSAIKWTLRILLDGDLGEITSEQRDFLEKTYQSNERMISLINDLLDVTRIEEGRYLSKLTLVNIEEVINLVVNSYKDEIKRRKIKFEFKKPEEKMPQIMVDVEKMGLVVQNLLDNAVHYTRPGGEVIISLNRGAKDIEFSIKDTGTGIPEEQQERIFTKFFRGTNAIKMEAEGSGLGLFIAKNIIDAHNGKIWFESKQGEGTTFYFNIPIYEKEEFTEFLTKF